MIFQNKNEKYLSSNNYRKKRKISIKKESATALCARVCLGELEYFAFGKFTIVLFLPYFGLVFGLKT